VATQALTEDDLEKIGDQVKEVTNEAFQCVDVETRRDTNICAREDSFIVSSFGSNQDNTREKDRGRTNGEYNKYYRRNMMISHPSEASGERRVMKLSTRALEFPSTEM
jgi:hypothetical protein